MDYIDYGIVVPRRGGGNVKTYCPKCRGQRKNKRDKSLSVNLSEGVWHCHHCGWSGALPKQDKSVYQVMKEREYKRPPRQEITDLPRPMVRWFADVRHISETALKALKVGAEPYQKNGKTYCWIVFNYYQDGELVTYKKRTADKQFRMFEGGKVIPYNIDSIKGKPVCYITEGEMDALAMWEAGFHPVISAPTGSNRNLSWLDDYIESHLDDKETIYICGDTDEAGRKLREELVVRLGSDRCKLVSYGDDCKDANDVLIKHGKAALQKCIADAQDIPQEGVFTEEDYHDQLVDQWRCGLSKGMTLGYPELDNIFSVETKRLMVVTGIPGSGKSEFIDEMCVRLNLLYGLKTAYYSPENMPLTYHAAKLMEKLTGTRMRESDLPYPKFMKAAEYIRDNFFHIMPETPTIDEILADGRWLVRKRGIKVLVIDPYNRIESNQPSGMSETNYISQVLDRLSEFALKNDCLVVLMAHPRKVAKDNDNGGIPTMYDINGSANFYNKADFGIVVHRDREAGNTLVKVTKVKFRHLGQQGDVRFLFNPKNGRYYPNGGDEDNRNYLETDIKSKPTPPPPSYGQKPYAWREENNDTPDFLMPTGEEQCPF